MSIIVDKVNASGQYVKGSAKVLTADSKKDTPSTYLPTPEEAKTRQEILKDFQLGWQTMHLPRPEFNDLSLYQRHITDMLSFNTYQPNDGNPMLEDRLEGWKSNAMRPLPRNKSISIAAHETARLTIPKIFAYNENSDEQTDAAKIMGYLVDWAREQANYTHTALFRVIMSLYSPISWGYSEYNEVYRRVKDRQDAAGKWTYKNVIDEDESGFQHLPVSTDQVYFANFYERNAQKQDFIILRRIISYDKAKAKYEDLYPNFKFVKPGIIITVSDANNGQFYNVYDPHMIGEDVEEVIRWRKSDDCKDIMVNGTLLTQAESPNPRQDHQYPMDCFYYLPINERCIAGKSLVFAMQGDATIVNTLYQLMIDGEILKRFPPTVTTGSDKIGMDVMVPGMNLAFSDKDVEVKPVNVIGESQSMMDMLEKVESSVSETSQDPIQQGQSPVGPPSTAYEISRIETNAATILGLSMKFIAQHAINYGKLLVSDIVQYLTIADVEKITDDGGLIYKTFFTNEPGKSGQMNKIQFDANMPETMTEDEKMEMSWKLLIAQGGEKANTVLYKVNPILFRNYKYVNTVDADVLNPRSADLIRAYDLETYDRAINNPMADQEMLYKDLLLSTNPKTSRNPDKYVKKQEPVPQQSDQNGQNPPQGPPQPGQASAPAQRGKPSMAKPFNAAGKLPQAV